MAEENQKSVFLDQENDYTKTVIPVAKPPVKKDIDLNKDLYQNIVGAAQNSVLDISKLEAFTQVSRNRNEMYQLIDTMCESSEVAAVLESYAEDCTETNDSGKIVWCEASDSRVAKIVDYFLDTLNVDKNIYQWCYSLCKYGDVYLRLYRESEYEDDLFKKKVLNEDVKIKDFRSDDRYAHYMEMVPNPAEMFELTKFGRTVGYIKAPSLQLVDNQNNIQYSTFHYKFKKGDVTLYPATEFVHACLNETVSRSVEEVTLFLENNESDNESANYQVKKGQSLFYPVFKDWRQLNLLEGSVLLNRLTKSSIIRLIQVEIGNMPSENVGPTLLGVKQMIEQKTALNTGNSMNEYNNPGPVENNVYIPVHDGIGAISAESFGGDVDVKSLADLDYFMNKFYGALRVPKQYFNQTDDSTGFNGGTSLSIISSRYAKTIKHIQNTLVQAITDAINLMLIDKKLDSYVNQFTIHMLPPTTQEEIDRRDNMSSKVQITSDIMNLLTDVENASIKLKILKNLLSNIVTDSEIITLIQDEIEKLEVEQEEAEKDEDIDQTEKDDFLDLAPETKEDSDFELTDQDQLETAYLNSTSSFEDQDLPSPEDLDSSIDFSDNLENS